MDHQPAEVLRQVAFFHSVPSSNRRALSEFKGCDFIKTCLPLQSHSYSGSEIEQAECPGLGPYIVFFEMMAIRSELNHADSDDI